MESQHTVPLPENNGTGTTYNLVEQVLDTDIFYDQARMDAFITGHLTTSEYGERFHVGMDVLRAVAEARWKNRQTPQNNAAYRNVSAADRNNMTMPAHEQLDDIRASLQPQRHRIQYINSLERHVQDLETGKQASPLREGQHNVFDAIEKFLNEPGQPNETSSILTKAGYIKMPTGMGKTVIAVELVRALGSPKALILTSRKDILRQTVGANGDRGFSRFAPNTNTSAYYQDEKDLSGNVVVMTYASFNNLLAKDEIDQSFCDLVICDEAHRALGPNTAKNIETFVEGKIAIGLTATDEYGENKKVGQILPERIYEIGLRECINKGWLSPVQAWIYKTSIEIEQDARGEFSTAELRRLADVEGRNKKGVEFAKSFVEQGIQGIISCIPGEDVRHAEDIAKMLRETEIVDQKTGEIRNIIAQELRGDMPTDVRQEIYENYEHGKIDVLTFVDMLTEGWDSHCAKFLINLRPTCSPVFGTQRLGRILRPTGRGIPAQVVDFVDVTQKAQFTTFHALGEYRYRAGKLFGKPTAQHGEGYKLINLPDYLRRHITGVDMRKIAEIVVGRPFTPDFSEPLLVSQHAGKLNLAEAAMIYIANQEGFTVESGIGGLGASTAQIREIDYDKIVTMLREGRYSWLRGQSEEWVTDYVAKREERLRSTQAAITATVVSMHQEGVHVLTAEEQQAQDEAAEQARLARIEKIQPHKDKDLDKLITALAKGRIDGEDFKQIIYDQARLGTILPKTAMRLGMGGKQEGLLGEAQKVLIEGLMQQPSLAMAAINIAVQIGDIKTLETQMSHNRMLQRCDAVVTLRDGTQFIVKGSAVDGKTAQQVAAVHIMAHISEIDMSNIVNPHIEIPVPPITDIGDLQLPEIQDAVAKLSGMFDKRSKGVIKIAFQGLGSHTNKDGTTYYGKVSFRGGRTKYEVIGKGATKTAAQEDAALRAIALHKNVISELVGLGAGKITAINRAAERMGPTKFLVHRSERLGFKLPVYSARETEQGTIPIVTVADNFCTLQNFEGPLVPFDETATPEQMRKRVRESRVIACSLAIEAFSIPSEPVVAKPTED